MKWITVNFSHAACDEISPVVENMYKTERKSLAKFPYYV
jgi:hypothetical protein